MDEKPKFRKQGYEINPLGNLGTILAIILGVLAYYQFAATLNIKLNIILLLSVTNVISSYFVAVLFFRLKKSIRYHNELYDDYKLIEDNRDTLAKMVNKKNAENEQLIKENFALVSQLSLFTRYWDSNQKPDIKEIEHAYKMNYDEVNDDE